MATINALKTVNENKTVLYTWTGLGQGDVGAPIRAGHLSDKTVQATGDFAGSATLPLQGSMDGVLWSAMEDTLGAAIVFPTSDMEVLLENPIFIRPGPVVSGNGTTDIDVSISAPGLR